MVVQLASSTQSECRSYVMNIPVSEPRVSMIQTMHPSDSRMHSWGPVTYTVGQQAIGYFPMAIFKAIGPVTVRFGLQSGQVKQCLVIPRSVI